MNTQRCALRFLSLRYEEAACQNPSDCCWPRILSTDLNIRAAQTMDVWVTPRSSAASRIARLAFLSACLFSSRRINEQALRKKIYTYIYMSNWSDGKCNFFLYWLRYIQVTHQRESDYWVIWVTKSVTQSVWKSMYAQKLRPPLSGVRFTEMGKRMGRVDQQFSTWKRWICVKDLFV